MIQGLKGYGMDVEVVDPWVDPKKLASEYGLKVLSEIPPSVSYRAVVAALAHRQFMALSVKRWHAVSFCLAGCFFDLKGIVPWSQGR